MGKSNQVISDEVMDSLVRYSWPGNIRELQNVIERAVILSKDGVLRPPELPRNEESPVPAPTNGSTQSAEREVAPDPSRPKTLVEAEREHISAVLRKSNWVLSGRDGAAVKLGLPRTTLLYKMRQLGIPRRPQ